MKKLLLFMLSMCIFTNIVNAETEVHYDLLTKNITKTQVQNGDYNRTQASILKKELDSVMGCNLSTSGAYGTLTVKCVKAFQRAYGLTVTGYVNKATREKLNEIYLMDSMIVIDDHSAFRDKAGFSGSTILGYLDRGYIIKVISRKKVGNRYWYRFYYNGRYVYMSERKLNGTFIEIEIVSQSMRFYKNRKLFVDTPVVTGRTEGNYYTRKGYFLAYDKSHNTSEDAHIQYAIAIDQETGQIIHDLVGKRGAYANYNTYGGLIYQNLEVPVGNPATGSLGCVNTPLERIQYIYPSIKTTRSNSSTPTPIIVH